MFVLTLLIRALRPILQLLYYLYIILIVMERPCAIFYKISNFMFVDFNWILLVIGVVYKCVVSYLASADLGRVEAKSPKYTKTVTQN